MSKNKQQTSSSAAAETKAPVSDVIGSGHSIKVNGETIEIPREVEAKGPKAIQAYLEQTCEKRGVSHIPAPAPKPASEPTAPATTPTQGK